MANRRPAANGRRMDFGRNDRGRNFRPGVSPWQGGAPGNDIPNLLPLGGESSDATLALASMASNIINLLQPRQNSVPSLLDMPIRRDFVPMTHHMDRGYGPNRMGNQGNFRRTGNYNRAGERINNRKPFRPNDGPRQHNKITPKKEADSKPKSKESDEDKKEDDGGNKEGTDNEEQKKEGQKTRYDDINQSLLKCHICNKSMWDGRSFENHLNGRAHAIMMQKTAESYALTADTMRQEFKIREMKRNRKTGQMPARDFYCAMCDMYAAEGSSHRTTMEHRKLKKYLHPTCTKCHKEIPTRIELDEHRLSPEHLRNVQNSSGITVKPKPEVLLISTLVTEQQFLRDDKQRQKRHRNQDSEQVQDKDADTEKDVDQSENKDEDGDENMEKGEKEKDEAADKQAEGPKESIDDEETILDYKDGDDMTAITVDKFPKYSTERGVGRSFLTEFRCVQCKLCRKLLDTDDTAEIHLRTWRHHQLFLQVLAEKMPKPVESRKRPNTDEGSDNWKRACIRSEDDDGNSATENGDKDEKEEMEVTEAETKQDPKVADSEVPETDELEDWEHSVDELLKDVADDEKVEVKEEEVVQVKEEKKEKEVDEPVATEANGEAKEPSTPAKRGRGRGRRRN
ncbi:unnamed protein product [Leptidea sinapis]|uniref:C2H2-type domain-containing protein n=1 Tax=Leptidea sinapis TaxID=189913 RepID=A0A5E4QG03_9NEOP|nr:unnamed protein product [Leptidea sinapis]